MIAREKLVPFYTEIETYKERQKAAAADIKDSFAAFSKEHGISVKSLKNDFKKYEEYQKNKTEFLEVDLETDALTQAWVPEYQESASAEEESY